MKTTLKGTIIGIEVTDLRELRTELEALPVDVKMPAPPRSTEIDAELEVTVEGTIAESMDTIISVFAYIRGYARIEDADTVIKEG